MCFERYVKRDRPKHGSGTEVCTHHSLLMLAAAFAEAGPDLYISALSLVCHALSQPPLLSSALTSRPSPLSTIPSSENILMVKTLVPLETVRGSSLCNQLLLLLVPGPQ